MTLEQREKLYHILGNIEGLAWGVENKSICDGFCGVVEDLSKLLDDDREEKSTSSEI